MYRTAKADSSKPTRAAKFSASASLTSLSIPMQTQHKAKGEAAAVTPPGQAHGSHKRARVATKTSGLGSRLRSTFQSLRISSSSNTSPPASITKPWAVGIDSTDMPPSIFDEDGVSNPLSPTPPPSRRSTRKAAASVLQSSSGTFRRLRAGTFSKPMSYPPAIGEPSIYDVFSLDDFVFVTPDMYPAAPAQSASTLDIGSMRGTAPGTNNRAVTPRLNQPLSGRRSTPRPRALTQAPKASEAVLVQSRLGYAGSTESLVPVSTPPLSASSSVVSLAPEASATSLPALQQTAQPQSRREQPQAKPHAWSPSRPPSQQRLRGQLQLDTASPSAKRPPLPSHAHTIAPAAGRTGKVGSPRKISECSFSSADDQRSLLSLVELDDLAPDTMPRLGSSAAKSIERRRRSSGYRPHRLRTQVSPTLSHWPPSNATASSSSISAASQQRHMRNMSGLSGQTVEFPLGHRCRRSFDFHVEGASVEAYWQRRDQEQQASREGGEDERLRSATFPSRLSPRFEFQMAVDSSAAFDMSRQQAGASGGCGSGGGSGALTRSASTGADVIRSIQHTSFPLEAQSILPMLDPRSPLIGSVSARSPQLLSSASSGMQCCSSPELHADIGQEDAYCNVPDMPTSAGSTEHIDFDGSTLTQPTDWLLMNGSGSDGEHPAMPTRRRRKRTVLPPTMFHASLDADKIMELVASASLYRSSISAETLLPGSEDILATIPELAAKEAPAAVAVAAVAVAVESTDITPDQAAAATEVDAAAIVAAATPVENVPSYAADMRSYAELASCTIPRVPLSIQMRVPVESLTGLVLRCYGDSGSWQTSRLPGFAMALVACIEHANRLQRLVLVNVGLVAILPCILQCRDLRSLDMSHNWINTVPGWLSRLRRLEHIVLAANPLSTVSADLVEMRQRLATLRLGSSCKWSLLSRQETPVQHTQESQRQLLCKRIEATAAKRMSAFLSSTRLSLTPRQHEASLDRATKLLALYANTMYSSLREPRTWGHSVALPYPEDLSLP
ncbi:hypothetical protein GQ54DRAFT_302374 [Martensiomyces pterosporus]|nr:hypothetical protein GQ54DRAFT_302374 [Martensiomyces pterosporus]